ncbi:dihydrodipicolinate synthase family protein [Caenimonas soli]|uniref:dihydrodipicolinate synthase family protein n=1 Tax=Caenimonas soli TaxID=2735555 RepID=UPI001553B7A2|nr:dihydrodipicolinate synthase family protein [Caenimonas soli]NPC58331.1 dihydrodipicolinate synthase family protein [Caenimonas soli]
MYTISVRAAAPTNISGILCSTVTPFRVDRRIDAEAFRAHLRMLLAAGCGGLVVNAVTGEGSAMTLAERAECIAIAVEVAAGAVPVIASVGLGSREESLMEARDAEELGATDLLLVLDAEGDLRSRIGFVAAIRKRTALSIIIYNKQASTSLGVDDIEALCAEVPGITGIAEGNQAQVPALVSRVRERIGVYCTRDSYILESVTSGAAGAVSFTANVAPYAAVRLWRMAQACDVSGARILQEQTTMLVSALLERGLATSIKSLMRALNVRGGHVREPLVDLTPGETTQLFSRFSQLTTLFP